MNFLDVLLNLILWIYVHNPSNLINDYVNGLQMTSNPDSYLTPPQIIAKNGYPIETHIVPTQDGYLLQLHRIPYGKSNNANKNKYPIFLIHGGPDSSVDWIVNGPEKSLAYLLADQGFDVWMMNMRGNTFSTAHTTYTPKDRQFWNFSLNDILIDLIYGMPLHHLNLNKDTASILLNNWPGGTSVKAYLHFVQMLDSFAYFDYGSEKNLKIYGTSRPAEYNISNIRVPIRVYYAISDSVAGPEEAIPLYEKLPVKAGIIEITDPMFYHMDYMSNANINQLLNDDVLNVIPYMIFNTSNQASP